MNYEIFKKQWGDMMVFRPKEFDYEQSLNDFYTDYKKILQKVDSEMSVKQFCLDWYQDCDLDTHPYMLKVKALQTHHGNSLKRMANNHREGTGEPSIPLIDEHLDKPKP